LPKRRSGWWIGFWTFRRRKNRDDGPTQSTTTSKRREIYIREIEIERRVLRNKNQIDLNCFDSAPGKEEEETGKQNNSKKKKKEKSHFPPIIFQ
jgi:hypothetical protein